MRRVAREEILDHVTYDERRAEIQPRAMAAKALRRVHVGPHLTFLFENAETLRYQVHEMIRAERIVRDANIRHELDTYNELLGGDGELGCTLLVEIDDPAERDRALTAWLDLPHHLYVRDGDGAKVMARFDPRQVGDTRLSSVQYLRFAVGGRVPVAVGCDLVAVAHVAAETALTDAQREALAADLGG